MIGLNKLLKMVLNFIGIHVQNKVVGKYLMNNDFVI
jgi:hypothetical protein